MSDLYNIPGDTGSPWRLMKFVEYQHEVPSIHYRFLGEWIKRHNISKDRAVNLCWLMSVTYNEITCIILDSMLNEEMLTPNEIWEYNKESLDFGSARKYAKNNDWFVPLMEQWNNITENRPLNWLMSQQQNTGEETYKRLQNTLRTVRYCGRFAADLFIESVSYLKDLFGFDIKEPPTIDWDNCANLTSGIYNIFYEDELAQEYDKKKKLRPGEKIVLENMLLSIQNKIREVYPEQDSEITMFIGKICSFRNLFKSARYGGFHHDRELGVIHGYEKSLPQYRDIYDDCYKLRKEIFPNRFLGEMNGWDGIRKERKKLWLTYGLTGVEESSWFL